jgi:hypothetical protein
MQSNFMRVVLGIAVVALAVVLLIALSDSDDGGDGGGAGSDGAGNGSAVSGGGDGDGDGGAQGEQGDATGAALAVPTVVVRSGAPVGGVRTLTYIKGDRIRFQVDSDVGDEVHVHGYDLSEDVEVGGSVRFDFDASLEGIFEVELEGRHAQIAELRVNP